MPRPRRLQLDLYQWLLIAAMVVYVAIFAALAFQFHAALRTNRADLGQIAQAVWNSSRGRLLQQTDNGFVATRLTDHVEPILVLISPVFWLWQDVRALLLLQAVALALGAWLLYHLALRRLDRALTPAAQAQIWQREPLRAQARPLALALAAAWLFAPQLQAALLTEFHAAPLVAPLALWALWAVEAQRRRQFAVAVVLVAVVKEETALLAALLGLWGAWRAWRQAREANTARAAGDATAPARGGVLCGLGLAAGSLAWFALATFVIVPHFAQTVYGVAQSGYFARYGALGDSPLDIVRSLFTQPALVWQILTEPARLKYLWDLIAAFALLPLLAPDLLLLALPVLAANVLSAYPAQFYGEFHYSAPVMPYMAAAAVFGLARLWVIVWRRTQGASPAFQHLPAASGATMAAAALARNPRTVLRPLAAALLALWVLGWSAGTYLHAGRAWGGGRWDPLEVSAHNRLLSRFTAQIPAAAPLTATAAIHPHVALRQFIYQFPQGPDAPQPATWALLDVTANTDMAPGDLKQRVDDLLAAGWGVVDAADGYLLLHKGSGAAQIPTDFYGFTLLAAAAPADGSVRAGTSDWARWRQTQLVATWHGWQPQWGNPLLDLISPAGDVLYALNSLTPPALIWRPADTWQAGDAARITTLPMSLPRSALLRAAADNSDRPIDLLVLHRTRNDVLRTLPVDYMWYADPDYAGKLAALTDFPLATAQAAFVGPMDQLAVTAWVEERPTWPGDGLDLWLQWRKGADSRSGWPDGYVSFVHLRHNGQTVAQVDGLPNLFIVDAGGFDRGLLGGGVANDWRTLTLPANADPTGAWTIVVGVYKYMGGQRLPLTTGGDEFTAATLHVTRAVPDQTCALIETTCAAQPAPR